MYKYLTIGTGIIGVALLFFASILNKQEGPLRIRIWHQKGPAEREVFDELVATYNKNHSDHQIEALYKETEELRSLYVIAAMGGKGPEIVYGPSDNVGILALTKAIQPLDNLFEASFTNQFDENGFVIWEGKKWSIADQVGNHLTLVYNKDLVPTPPKTFAELIEIGKSLTKDENGDGRTDQYGLVWNFKEPFFFIPFLTAFDGWVMDPEGNPTLDNQQTIDAIQFILDLRDKYKIIPKEIDYDTAEAIFKDGRAGMIINGPWAWSGYGEAGINYGLALIPQNEANGQWAAPMISQKGYSVNANVKGDRLPYVKQVLEFLTGKETQALMAEKLATIPVNREVLQSSIIRDSALLREAYNQLKVGREMPVNPRMRQIWDGMRGPYQLVTNGEISPQEGARMMQVNCEKLIADTFL